MQLFLGFFPWTSKSLWKTSLIHRCEALAYIENFLNKISHIFGQWKIGLKLYFQIEVLQCNITSKKFKQILWNLWLSLNSWSTHGSHSRQNCSYQRGNFAASLPSLWVMMMMMKKMNFQDCIRHTIYCKFPEQTPRPVVVSHCGDYYYYYYYYLFKLSALR